MNDLIDSLWILSQPVLKGPRASQDKHLRVPMMLWEMSELSSLWPQQRSVVFLPVETGMADQRQQGLRWRVPAASAIRPSASQN